MEIENFTVNKKYSDIYSKISHELYNNIKEEYPEQIETAAKDDCAGLEVFPGSMNCNEVMYKALSITIPKTWTIIDIGCSYAAQAYHFKNHKKYIGIDITPVGFCTDFKNMEEGHFRFTFENTEHWVKNATDLTQKDIKDFDLDKTFAILSYNPLWLAGKNTDKLKETQRIISLFKNVYSFYPA